MYVYSVLNFARHTTTQHIVEFLTTDDSLVAWSLCYWSCWTGRVGHWGSRPWHNTFHISGLFAALASFRALVRCGRKARWSKSQCMTGVKVTSQIFSHWTYIISTAKPPASMKKKFGKLMHSTETLVCGCSFTLYQMCFHPTPHNALPVNMVTAYVCILLKGDLGGLARTLNWCSSSSKLKS